jgi:TRAP-type C4-dicarboxylate transport system permease small subunit
MSKETTSNMLNKLSAICLTVFVIFLICFSTWQLFHGNLEAAFSSLPFLLIIYLFVMRRRA